MDDQPLQGRRGLRPQRWGVEKRDSGFGTSLQAFLASAAVENMVHTRYQRALTAREQTLPQPWPRDQTRALLETSPASPGGGTRRPRPARRLSPPHNGA